MRCDMKTPWSDDGLVLLQVKSILNESTTIMKIVTENVLFGIFGDTFKLY